MYEEDMEMDKDKKPACKDLKSEKTECPFTFIKQHKKNKEEEINVSMINPRSIKEKLKIQRKLNNTASTR